MKKTALILFLNSFLFLTQEVHFPQIIKLNGIVEFEQTVHAFPPEIFTRKIQVPGLIDLAKPRIEQYKEYFYGQQKPRYSWYRFKFSIDSSYSTRFAILKLLKSRYNTQIILNGFDCGTYMQCNTPIEADLTDYLKYNQENILLVRVGDRKWLPKESAIGYDREKYADIPGIWDDVFITLTGPIEINRILVLPNAKDSKVKVRLKLENRSKFIERNMELSEIKYSVYAFIREKEKQTVVSDTIFVNDKLKCEQSQIIDINFDLNDYQKWCPDNPFLYEAVVAVIAKGKYFDNYGNVESKKPDTSYSWLGKSDEKQITFGIRDFKISDKKFLLNGEEIKLFGSSFTLNRFFEDRNRDALPWDKKWVEKLMVKIPKSLGWNTFRVSIGLLPSFWYDLADKYGFLIQNEYPMWNLRGRNNEVKKEYTDWVWSDGNHPSIVIWDALNEQTNSFVGKELLPTLRKLDPTRIWDAGWNTVDEMAKIEMKEIHWYTLAHGWWSPDDRVKKQRENYRFGNLFSNVYGLENYSKEKVPLILNEYSWLWLNRDGKKSAIRTYGSFTEEDKTPYKYNYEYFEPDGRQLYSNRDIYDYYVGEEATPKQRRDFQAYLLGIETEVARASGLFAGVISFPYLTNNNGYTGDWFKENISKLEPTAGLLVQYHVMKPFAVFIDLEDGRYIKKPKLYKSGSKLSFNLFIINDLNENKKGYLLLKLLNSNNEIVHKNEIEIKIDKNSQKEIPIVVNLPKEEGGYMFMTELDDIKEDNINQVSRRYIRIGEQKNIYFPNYIYKLPVNYPIN